MRSVGRSFVLAAALTAGAGVPVAAGTVALPAEISGAYAVTVDSLKEKRARTTVLQRYDFSCGSAALSTLLTHHYGVPVGEQEVFEQMFAQGDRAKIQREGFSLLDMRRYLSSRGFEAHGFEAPLDELAKAGIPGIVLINERGYNHFVVVKGLRSGRVLLGDPAGGTRAMSRAAFESMWLNRVLFVVTNRMESASFNAPADWRAAPEAPLTDASRRNGAAGFDIPKLGPSDF
ncbi:C39 family peptidase [Azohydromonas sp.]|uniref:C39 family peptidase n=1 Tax=Azohydromonas sp. TaxID=1872666 RepID=UPI002BC8AEDA|nr:C39 family peptidase [Azohydromonas sp.]HMM86094.1 C39 family peptidase [Azohydromonas sp.]